MIKGPMLTVYLISRTKWLESAEFLDGINSDCRVGLGLRPRIWLLTHPTFDANRRGGIEPSFLLDRLILYGFFFWWANMQVPTPVV